MSDSLMIITWVYTQNYERYMESNLRWAVNKTSDERKNRYLYKKYEHI
jgi:hypothetical protein